MLTMPERKSVFFDVDSTLVFASNELPDSPSSGRMVRIGGRDWMVHEPHVETIKDFVARGHTVILWSQGGPSWAAKVARALEIDGLVWACMGKPDWIFDDKPVTSWITPDRSYYKNP